jgi:hypothetical protein
MSNISLTPEQIKSIASEIRRTETQKLGTKLPNTTALNAITRSLGLGPDFRTFKAGFEAQAEEIQPVVTMSNICIYVENDSGAPLCEDHITSDIDAIITDAGFTWFADPGSHGFSTVSIFSTGDKHNMSELVALKDNLLTQLQKLHEEMEIGKIIGAVHWQTTQPDKELTVNFRYHDNGQVCSATVSESAWKARKMIGQSDEFCLLAFYCDTEIEPEYTPEDITVEDIMTDVCFWYDD